jgi:hypothetical protein
MAYVLVVITVFSSSGGIATNTSFHEFLTESACESAREGIDAGMRDTKGTMAREIITGCYRKG